MKIYTKTGDAGTTGLLGGQRVPKDDPRIEAYGTVDELNALIGLARSQLDHADVDEVLEDLQNSLFGVGASLASPNPQQQASKWISETMIADMEATIDRLEHELPALCNFILPAGSTVAACMHAARAVCRRAERRVVTLHRIPSQKIDANLITFLNRVGDLLFVLSRYANQLAGKPDIPWKQPETLS